MAIDPPTRKASTQLKAIGHGAAAIVLALLFTAIVGASVLCFLVVIGYFGGYDGIILAVIASIAIGACVFAYTVRTLYRGFRTASQD
jgi:hypothetical protein